MSETCSWSCWSQVAAGAFTALAALFAGLSTFRVRQAVDLGQQLSNIPEFLRDEYLERPIRDDAPSLKTRRWEAREALKVSDVDFYQRTCTDGDPLNRYAHQVSLALDRVGLSVLTGSIPLGVVLDFTAPTIVEDWRYCQVLVSRIRAQPAGPLGAYETAGRPFRRRHAEWLALIAIVYMRERWSTESFASWAGESDALRSQIRRLMSSFTLRIPRPTRREINAILTAAEGGS